MDAQFEYVFPSIRGVQAGREYFVSMCPLRLIPKIFLFDEEELKPEVRAQRALNKGRIPELKRYIVDNIDGYVFSALTASIDSEVQFDPLGAEGGQRSLGLLRIPMSARFIINDGQHRRAAIEAALREEPNLGDETIAVVFFLDIGLERCQQMFADLNRHAVRASRSLGLLYDFRDEMAKVTKLVAYKSVVFRDVIEKERSSLSPRSRKLFTLSALYTANSSLLADKDNASIEDQAALAARYWDAVGPQFPEWRFVREGKMSAGEVRRDFIHSHGVVLHALGRLGACLFEARPRDWRKPLDALGTIDWARSNAALWEGRAMLGGRVSKSRQNVVLTTNVMKRRLGLSLAADEQRIEDAFNRRSHELAS